MWSILLICPLLQFAEGSLCHQLVHIAERFMKSEDLDGARLLSALILTQGPDLWTFITSSGLLVDAVRLLLKCPADPRCHIIWRAIETMLEYGEGQLDSKQQNPVTLALRQDNVLAMKLKWAYKGAKLPIDLRSVLIKKYFL